jgi:N-acylneuraminate cytidylyltransferase
MWRIGKDGYAIPVAQLEELAEPYNMPRQLLPMVYWQDGYIDITRPEVIFEQHSTTGRRILPFLIEEECVEIDYEEEFLAAEQLLVDRSVTALRRSGPAPNKHPS